MKPVAQYPMLIAALGIMLFSMMDAVMKGQALSMGTYNAMFWRMAMGALIVAILYLPTRPVPASGRVLKIHLIRAALTAVMAYLFFFGLTRIPLAQAIGLSFIAPIITLFLAVPILGERIGANAKLAAVLGFGGVMVVVGGELLAVDEGSDRHTPLCKHGAVRSAVTRVGTGHAIVASNTPRRLSTRIAATAADTGWRHGPVTRTVRQPVGGARLVRRHVRDRPPLCRRAHARARRKVLVA